MTVERQPNTKKQPTIYTITRTDVPEHPVVIEHGGPEYMAMYYTSDPDVEGNWYGLMESQALFARLRLEVTENLTDTIFTWKFIEAVFGNEGDSHHYSAGDIFASYTFDHMTAPEDEDVDDLPSYTLHELMDMTLPELRHVARDNGVDYFNTQSRAQLAMVLNAPVPQDPRCPSCKATTGTRHNILCEIAQCVHTGLPRQECSQRKHKNVGCGHAYWIGFEPGVIESFAYSTTPDAIIANATWDKDNEVFIYGNPEEDIDETYTVTAPAPDPGALNDMLTGLMKNSVSNATQDEATQNAAEKVGIDTDEHWRTKNWDAGHRRVADDISRMEHAISNTLPEGMTVSFDTSPLLPVDHVVKAILTPDADTDTPDDHTAVSDPHSGPEDPS